MDRPIKPYEQIKAMLGNDASRAWERLAGYIRFHYVMDEKWDEGKPTNKHYNNLYFRRSGKALITFCVREEYFMAYVVLGKAEREKFNQQRDAFSETICKAYDEAETYHDGKWLGFDIYDETLVEYIIQLVNLKRKPNRKILPKNMEKCGILDLGMSHEEVTKHIF